MGSTTGQLSVFDINDPAKPTRLSITNGGGWITALSFDRSRPLLAATVWLYTTTVWDLSNPRTPLLLMSRDEDRKSQVYDVRFSPDGRWLASSDRDGATLIWPVTKASTISDSLRPAQKLASPVKDTPAIDFSPDGRLLVAATRGDGAVRLWSLDRNAGLAHQFSLPSHVPPETVLFGADGTTVTVAFDDAPTATYIIDPDRVADLLCMGSGEPITREQWRAYLPDYSYDPPCKER